MRVKTRKPPEEKAAEVGVAASKHRGKVPADCDATERKGYYAHLERKFGARKVTYDEEGRRVIWTDGSAVEDGAGKMRAGAGIFHGVGNEKNRSVAVDGLQSESGANSSVAMP